jgi:hypothetical protein
MSTGYLFGPKFESGQGTSKGQYFQIARVKSIVMGPNIVAGSGPTGTVTNLPDPDYTSPRDIGKIRYELLYSQYSTSKSREVSEPAYPIWYFVKQYPLVNEIVLIIVGPSVKLNDGSTKQQYYYMPAYGMWNNPNHNAFPNMDEWADYLNNFANKPGYSGNSTDSKTLPLGRTFQENAKVKDLQPFEGDTIIQARFGQSIRFGSTVSVLKRFNTWSNNSSDSNGDPITIITNSQGNRNIKESDKFNPVVEDINKDGSSIYLTSTQEINLVDLNNFPLASFGVGINPIVQQVVEVQRKPISDEVISAQSQDQNTIG